MRVSVGLLLLNAAGCGSLFAPPRPTLSCGEAPSATAAASCPSRDALVAHLRDRWGLDAHTHIDATCTPGAFGEPAWLVHATASDARGSRTALFLLQPTCAAVTSSELHPTAPGDDALTFELHDLDGDGVDEVVARRTTTAGLAHETMLEVSRLADGRLVPAGKVRLTYDDGAAHCASDLRYTPGASASGLVIEIDATATGDPAGCLEPGHHILELKAGGLHRVL